MDNFAQDNPEVEKLLSFCYDESSFTEIFRLANNPFTAEYIMDWPQEGFDFEQSIYILLSSGNSILLLYGTQLSPEETLWLIDTLCYMAPNSIKIIIWNDLVNDLSRIALGSCPEA